MLINGEVLFKHKYELLMLNKLYASKLDIFVFNLILYLE